MAVFELLDEKSIKIELESTTKQDVLEELVDLLVDSGKIQDKHTILDAIEERESQASTGLENGVAVPHCKSDAVKKLTAALGVSRNGIEFDSFDKKPAQIFFILVAEKDNPGPHVKALAKLARLLKSSDMREAILNSRSSAECLELIKQRELEN